MTQQKGFTLIELMIVVAIIAILAAIALPAYQDYTIRGQVSEGLSLASGSRTAVAEFFANRGDFPADNTEAGLSAAASIAGTYVESVEVDGGQITATFSSAAPFTANKAIDGETLILSPSDNGGAIQWTCLNTSTVDAKYLPTSCR